MANFYSDIFKRPFTTQKSLHQNETRTADPIYITKGTEMLTFWSVKRCCESKTQQLRVRRQNALTRATKNSPDKSQKSREVWKNNLVCTHYLPKKPEHWRGLSKKAERTVVGKIMKQEFYTVACLDQLVVVCACSSLMNFQEVDCRNGVICLCNL